MSYYKIFFVALLIGVSFSFYYIIFPFFLVIIFALIFAHFFKKPHRYFVKRFNKNIASVFSVLLVVIVIVIPFFLAIILLSVEASHGYEQIQKFSSTNIEDLEDTLSKNKIYQDIRNNPEILDIVSSLFFDKSMENIEDVIKIATTQIKIYIAILFKHIQSFLVNITNLIISFLVMLYLLYFFFKEGDNVLHQLKNFIPMQEEETQELIDEAFKIIDATFIGTLIIGVLEGTYGALIFFWQGVPSPVTWGLIMIVVSMMPVVGTNGILVPLVIYRFIVGNYMSAILILVIGCGGIVISQNIVKPKLLGDRSGLHPALIVISTLGGIYTMGVVGFLIGPIVATIFVVFWKLFREKNINDHKGVY